VILQKLGPEGTGIELERLAETLVPIVDCNGEVHWGEGWISTRGDVG